MAEMIKVLMIEDVATEAELACRELLRGGLLIDAVRVETRAEFLTQLETFVPDIILSDFSLPAFDGMSALAITNQSYPHIPFIFVSGTIGESTAIDALKCGAADYLLKTSLQRLPSAVTRAIEAARERAARVRAENRFRDLIEYAPHAIVVLDRRGAIEIVNAEAESLFGYGRRELIGADAAMLVSERFGQWHTALTESNAMASSSVSIEVMARRRDGSEFPAEVGLSPLPTADGLCISTVIRDISERKAQQERLARMTRIRTILGSINSVILRVHDKQKLLDEACRIAFEQGEFAGAVVGLVHPETQVVKPVAWAGMDSAFVQNLDVSADLTIQAGQGIVGAALRSKVSTVSNDIRYDPRLAHWREALLQRGYRSVFVVPLMVGQQAFGILALFADKPNAFNEDEQRLLAELAADISFSHDFIDKEEQINYLAYFDALTGLPNRTLFQDRVGQLTLTEYAAARSMIAVVLLDIERFRHINDSFGRASGDDLLRVIGRRLRECLPDAGYLARIAADTFAFIVRGARSETDVVHLLEGEVRLALAEPIQIRDKTVRLSARAGIAMFPSDGIDGDSLLRNAEAALKDAKMAKARLLFYTAEMNARTTEKISLENRLRHALEEQQFVLHYQPKVDLQSGQIVGMEALIRWDEPGVGLVSPLNFIHVLEDTGMIVEVGLWVVAQAHAQYQAWQAAGLVVPRIAVNVSQLQIRQKDFVTKILQVLGQGSTSALELEITESLFMDDNQPNVSRAKLAALRESGMTVAIDDFGTGYSSLSYLARLPIDTLKIDQSFITGMTSSHENMAIVSTIISLAHALKLQVVAEGVETIDQREQLKQLGCDQMQGFLFGAGLPAAEMAALLPPF